MICKACGAQVHNNVKFCPKCGTKIPVNTPNYVAGTVAANNTQSNNGKGSSKTGLIITLVSVISVIVIGAIIAVIALMSNGDATLSGTFKGNASQTIQHNSSTSQNNSAKYMPQCTGWTKAQVEQYFSSYKNITFTYEYSSSVAVNDVISQNISAFTEITPASEIVFVISLGPDICPVDYKQKIVVTGSSSSHNATMELFSWENGGWRSEYICSATVGRNGIGSNYGEGKGVTPMGTFKLGVILSKEPVTKTGWDVEIVNKNTCIVDDSSSPYYNTIMNKNNLPSGVHYDPIGKTILDGYSTKCMYIEHNGNGYSSNNVIPGKGSAITICGRNKKLTATAGCVDISSEDMENIISKLDIANNPHIEIVIE